MNCPNCSTPLKLETRIIAGNQRVLEICSNCEFSAGKNYLKVEELWAWVSVDPLDHNEGIIAFQSPAGPMPMVGADQERMESMRNIAVQVVKNSGIEVKLLKFSTRTEIETIQH